MARQAPAAGSKSKARSKEVQGVRVLGAESLERLVNDSALLKTLKSPGALAQGEESVGIGVRWGVAHRFRRTPNPRTPDESGASRCYDRHRPHPLCLVAAVLDEAGACAMTVARGPAILGGRGRE